MVMGKCRDADVGMGKLRGRNAGGNPNANYCLLLITLTLTVFNLSSSSNCMTSMIIINNNNNTATMFMVLSSWPWSLQEFTRFIWWMQTECRVAANSQAKPTDLGCESADKWLLPSTSTIAIHYGYSAWKLRLILPLVRGWKDEST